MALACDSLEAKVHCMALVDSVTNIVLLSNYFWCMTVCVYLSRVGGAGAGDYVVKKK